MKFFAFVVLFFVMACRQDKKYHDILPYKTDIAQADGIGEILQFQEKLNEEFKNPETSPLPDRYRKDFEGLDFFPPDTSYVVKAKLIRTPNAVPFLMPTTTERESKEVVYGIAQFWLYGNQYELELYQNQELMHEEGYADYLFLPFIDQTNGGETYTGGRYIDLRIPKGDTIIIDFNKAYNPYCVYNKKYSCPIVPSVNTLTTKILAGVKVFRPKKK